MRKRTFINNALALSASSLLVRGLAMLLTVRTASVMGGEMLGRFRLVMSIYAFFILLTVSGVNITVTRLAGEELARGNEAGAGYIRNKAAALSFCGGAALGGVMLALSFLLPTGFFGSGAANALRLLSPALPFAGFSSAVRGYFTAKRKNLRNAAGQILSQLTELCVFVLGWRVLEDTGCSPVFCACLAVTAAEALSFIYSALLLHFDIRRTQPPKRINGPLRRARPIFVPCAASSGLRSALSLAENCLIPAGLMVYSGAQGRAMEDFGIISGMALPCVLFPSVFIIPASQLIVPELAAERALGHKNAVIHMSKKLLRWTAVYSIAAMLPFLLFPGIISNLLGYPEKAGFFIRDLAPLIPLSFLDSVIDGMLKGLDCQKSYFRINMVESVLRIIMALALVPLFGALGAAALILCGELVNVSLSLLRLLRELKVIAAVAPERSRQKAGSQKAPGAAGMKTATGLR